MSKRPNLLLVDEKLMLCRNHLAALGKDFLVTQVASAAQAIVMLKQTGFAPDMVLLNAQHSILPHGNDTLHRLLGQLLAVAPQVKILALSETANVCKLLHLPIFHHANLPTQPLTLPAIQTLLSAALKCEQTIASSAPSLLGIVGISPNMQALREQIALYAAMPFPVLIQGESGCGKELIASALQKLSPAHSKPYKILNCAAISPSLLESTLFGHSKGAYTGAHNAQAGFFEEAAEGTLLLDEIGELPLDMQANLLRVLENGEYQRVGETQTRTSHARIIAATNRDLRLAVKTGKFRADLYHRLNVFSLTAPPLRELGADKLLLLHHFRHIYTQQIQCLPFVLHSEALGTWEQYHFPGNTRELRNIVLRLCAKYSGKKIRTPELQDEFEPSLGDIQTHTPALVKQQMQGGLFDLNQELRTQENLYIGVALELASHSITGAAKLLGINRTTLYSRLDAHEKLSRPL
jgi:DNA-binding NtrC family response regulator